jgi:monothiol glutaredoxin
MLLNIGRQSFLTLNPIRTFIRSINPNNPIRTFIVGNPSSAAALNKPFSNGRLFVSRSIENGLTRNHLPATFLFSNQFISSFSTPAKNPVHEKIDKIVKSNDLVLFMKGTPDKPMCGFSRMVVQILDAQGVKNYAHVNILAEEDIRQGAKEYSNWPTFPQVYVKGEFVGGCDIMTDMFKNGELNKLLVEAGLLKE